MVIVTCCAVIKTPSQLESLRMVDLGWKGECGMIVDFVRLMFSVLPDAGQLALGSIGVILLFVVGW